MISVNKNVRQISSRSVRSSGPGHASHPGTARSHAALIGVSSDQSPKARFETVNVVLAETGSDPWQDSLLAQWKAGVAVSQLAERFRITSSTVLSALSNARLRRVRSAVVSFIDSPEFTLPDAEKVCSQGIESSEFETPVVEPLHAGGKLLPSYLSSLYSVPLLTREQERDLFRHFNYLKFRFLRQRSALSPQTPIPSKILTGLDQQLDSIAAVRDRLIRSNLRLVVSIARKYTRSGVEFFDLVSDGNVSLMRAVEKFDYMRGNKFSTYATWAVMKNFARSIPVEHRQLDRFRTGLDDALFLSTESRSTETADLTANQVQRTVIRDLLSQLDEREQKVLSCRFGLASGSEPETLEQVGSHLGVTKERVRQIEVRSLTKLRRIAERQNLEIPGF
jgi:RNA polymerase sigma factor (sigma-70 family)